MFVCFFLDKVWKSQDMPHLEPVWPLFKHIPSHHPWPQPTTCPAAPVKIHTVPTGRRPQPGRRRGRPRLQLPRQHRGAGGRSGVPSSFPEARGTKYGKVKHPRSRLLPVRNGTEISKQINCLPWVPIPSLPTWTVLRHRGSVWSLGKHL